MTQVSHMSAGRELASTIVMVMTDMKADDISVYRAQGELAICDWIVICSGNGPVHSRAIAQSVMNGLAKQGCRAVYREGLEDGRWAILDYADVIVHVLSPDMRAYYKLEQLWQDYARLGADEAR